MMVVAVVGLSGVGKSTLIRRVAADLAVQHFEASELIKAEQARRAEQVESSEALRLGPVLDNQALLIASFRRSVQPRPDLVLLDGHVLVDGSAGPVPIPADVFAALGCGAMIFVRDAPRGIVERRKADSDRIRPLRSVLELAEQQQMAWATADAICRNLGIPLHAIAQADSQTFGEVLAVHHGAQPVGLTDR